MHHFPAFPFRIKHLSLLGQQAQQSIPACLHLFPGHKVCFWRTQRKTVLRTCSCPWTQQSQALEFTLKMNLLKVKQHTLKITHYGIICINKLNAQPWKSDWMNHGTYMKWNILESLEVKLKVSLDCCGVVFRKYRWGIRKSKENM